LLCYDKVIVMETKQILSEVELKAEKPNAFFGK